MYCGVDIIEVSRIESSITENENFKYKIFSKNEIEDIDYIKSKVKFQRYAGRFAAKEAVYKAISKILIQNNLTINFNEIEILNDMNFNRRPVVNILNNTVNKLLSNYEIDISISHIEENATAMCIISDK